MELCRNFRAGFLMGIKAPHFICEATMMEGMKIKTNIVVRIKSGPHGQYYCIIYYDPLVFRNNVIRASNMVRWLVFEDWPEDPIS